MTTTSTQQSVNADIAYEWLAQRKAPDGLRVEGVLDYSMKSGRVLPVAFPESLHVDVLDLSDRELETLPRGLTEESSLPVGLSRTQLRWAGVAVDLV